MTFKLMATKYCETTIFNGTFHRFNVLLSLHSFWYWYTLQLTPILCTKIIFPSFMTIIIMYTFLIDTITILYDCFQELSCFAVLYISQMYSITFFIYYKYLDLSYFWSIFSSNCYICDLEQTSENCCQFWQI